MWTLYFIVVLRLENGSFPLTNIPKKITKGHAEHDIPTLGFCALTFVIFGDAIVVFYVRQRLLRSLDAENNIQILKLIIHKWNEMKF